MISIMFIVQAVSLVQVERLVPDPSWTSTLGFTETSRSRNDRRVRSDTEIKFERKSDQCELRILAAHISGDVDHKVRWKHSSPIPEGRLTDLPLSGKTWSQSSSGGPQVYGYFQSNFVEVSISMPSSETTLSVEHSEFADSTYRLVMARLIGDDLNDGKIGGRVYHDLNDWASSKQLTLNLDQRRGTFGFSKNGHRYMGALACDQLQIDGAWTSISAPVVVNQSHWYVPCQEIERLLQESDR